MIVAGLDIGSATGKAVVMGDGEILSSHVLQSTANPRQTADIVMERAITDAGLSSLDDVDYVVSTGYGRLQIPFAGENLSEISCHAKGAHWMDSTVRTVVDIGGQDCKVISIGPGGRVLEFVMNDRCAAGTGRFFESMARALCCGLDGISLPQNQGDEPCSISHQCTVFAESEVVTLVNEGTDIRNIVAGINRSVATRVSSMVRRVGLIPEVALTGGCSKNQGLAMALEAKLGLEVKTLSSDPQIAGALGAALFAAEKAALSTAATSPPREGAVT
jgi:predicted CoA-substrate-specific enzyme activase